MLLRSAIPGIPLGHPLAIGAALLLVLPGCASLVKRSAGRVADNLMAATLDQTDPITVREGAPAFLLMIDGLIEGDPDDVDMLLGGAQLYDAFTVAFVVDPARARRLTDKSLRYARRALEIRCPDVAGVADRPYDVFAPQLETVGPEDIGVLYGFGVAWAGWVQARSSDWNAIALLPKIEAVLQRVVALDDTYGDGAPHLYLAVLSTQLPPDLGGRPEVGRDYFERAIALSEGRNLMAKVLYAKRYARLVFDQELHDRLLAEVLASEPEAPGFTLSNVLAQEQAQVLLDESGDYF